MLDPENLDYELVFTPERARSVIERLQEEEHWALDFETTALTPKEGRVRLTTIARDDEIYVLDHDNCGNFDKLGPLMVGPTYIVFNAGFEMRWFDSVAPEQVTLWDVGVMRKAVMGGGGYSLASMVKWDLEYDMSKAQQLSDWSQERLGVAQLNYAAFDGYVTWELYKLWRSKMNDGHWRGFHVINDVWRGNNEMESVALQLDIPVHQKNIKTWDMKYKLAKRYFERFTPPSIIKNINSRKQVSDFLKKELHPDTVANWPTTDSGKDLSLARDTIILASAWLPYPMNRWLLSFMLYHFWYKYSSTYGEKLVTIQQNSGKVHARFNVAAARTGRYSSSSINLQNIPRKPYIRKAFYAPPLSGDTMVLADYSGIEVRVLAEISDDEQLKHDCIYGNVHGEGAAMINGIDPEDFMAVLADKTNKRAAQYKELRNRAKVFTFRLTYGAGLGALAMSLKRGLKETEEALERWMTRYPKAYNYRFKMADMMEADGFIPVYDGRTIYVPKFDRSIPVAANYPVQGAAASVMYRAIYHTRNEYIGRDLDAVLAATVHDELLSYAAIPHAEQAMEAKIAGMTQGWLDIFPGTSTDNLLDYAVGPDWSCKP